MSGEILQPLIDADNQGMISASVTWEGDRKQEFTFGDSIPDSTPMYSVAPAGLILMSAPFPERTNEKTWLPEGQLVRSLDHVTRELDPSESVSDEFSLWGDPEHVDSIEPGSYSFAGRFHEGTLDEIDGTVQYELEVDVSRRE